MREFTEFDEAEVLELLEFQSTAPEPDYPRPGQRFAEFSIEREIGRGGCGVVYRARQPALDRSVALKVVPVAPALDTGAHRDRFEAEIRALATLGHPAIITVYAAGSAPGFRYVAMELIDGPTLAQLIAGDASGDLPRPGQAGWIELVQRVIRGVASALGEAHARGIVHRDVKPQNILVDREGNPHLVDFGLARREDASELSWTSHFVGTPGYASPEQTLGQPLGASSDVFSLGATAFAAFTGQRPFRGTSRTKLIDSIQLDDVRWPESPRLSTDVRAIVERCLEKSAAQRYADAGQVAQELDRLARYEPVLARPRGRLVRALRYARRRPARVIVPTVVLSFAVAAVVAGFAAARSGSQVREMEARNRLADARRLIRAGRLDEARPQLVALRNQTNFGPRAAGLLGDLHVERSELAAAERAYELAVRGDRPTLADLIGLEVTRASLGQREPARSADWPEPVSARDHDALGRLLRARGSPHEAVEELDLALGLEPASYLWRRHRATVLDEVGRVRDAAADLRILRMMRPADVELILALASELAELGENEEAASLLDVGSVIAPERIDLQAFRVRLPAGDRESLRQRAKRLFDEHPDDPAVCLARSHLLRVSGRAGEARAVARDALAAHPGNTGLLIALGRTLTEPELRYGELETVSRELRDLPSRLAKAYGLYFLSAIQRGRGDDRAADETFEQLERVDPEQAEWRLYHGEVLLGLDEADEALRKADEALALGLRDARIYYVRGLAARANGDFSQALDSFEQALVLDPKRAGETSVWLADCWIQMNVPRAGLRYANAAIAAHPAWYEGWLRLAWAQQALGDLEAAASSYETALRQRSVPGVRSDYAEVLYLCGREREAIEQYQQARSDDPSVATAYCGEALIRLDAETVELRDAREAVRLMRRAIELDPDGEDYDRYLERAERAAADR